ncbi:hypothetical protein BV898_20142, partial [Hypsibius exemplaris]
MIGCMCVSDSDETLPPGTVITGEYQNRRIAEKPQAPPLFHRRAFEAPDQATTTTSSNRQPGSSRQNGFTSDLMM